MTAYDIVILNLLNMYPELSAKNTKYNTDKMLHESHAGMAKNGMTKDDRRYTRKE